MVRPATFRSNEETAVNNYYQKSGGNEEGLLQNAQTEFDGFVEKLRNKGVNVIVVEGIAAEDTPDAHFPNNWISFHADGTVALYPMFAKNRRRERREDILDLLEEKGFHIENMVDYSSAESDGLFLEGTGSILIDRINKKADTIDDKKERKNVIAHLKEDGKEIITITEKQVTHFAGNMLQVIGADEKRFMVMSTDAYQSLQTSQIGAIEKYCEIIHSNIQLIETCGGGSARCMMAEVFLPNR